MRAVVLLALVALAVTAGNAHAVDRRLPADEQVAYAYWGARPACPAGVEFSVANLPANIGAYALPPCGVQVASAMMIRYRGGTSFHGVFLPVAWVQDTRLCDVVVHEVGHLLGHPHSADPYDVMFGGATDSRWLDSVPACAPPHMVAARRIRRRR